MESKLDFSVHPIHRSNNGINLIKWLNEGILQVSRNHWKQVTGMSMLSRERAFMWAYSYVLNRLNTQVIQGKLTQDERQKFVRELHKIKPDMCVYPTKQDMPHILEHTFRATNNKQVAVDLKTYHKHITDAPNVDDMRPAKVRRHYYQAESLEFAEWTKQILEKRGYTDIVVEDNKKAPLRIKYVVIGTPPDSKRYRDNIPAIGEMKI